MRGLEPVHIVAVDGRLPEELHEASKVERIVRVGLQQLVVDLAHQLLKLFFNQHRVVHVVLSIQFHQLADRDYFFVCFRALQAVGGHLPAECVVLNSILVEKQSEEASVFLKHEPNTVFLSVLLRALKVYQHGALFAPSWVLAHERHLLVLLLLRTGVLYEGHTATALRQ